jgi:hypothetical protein
MVEYLLCKYKALSSSSCHTKQTAMIKKLCFFLFLFFFYKSTIKSYTLCFHIQLFSTIQQSLWLLLFSYFKFNMIPIWHLILPSLVYDLMLLKRWYIYEINCNIEDQFFPFRMIILMWDTSLCLCYIHSSYTRKQYTQR